ncbi:MAG: hypothetical protein A2W91_14850 [Bacteroidetes bacterium GWF2_38_335]|nr:MAG: hypothetical protein A2W91_14850 [Bacteroidetes bacterium GWF2_38_335]OFY78478.1 MAG: hypothetical protein A2281_16160 [Bacteroidetes bacterium RIFOXYA12_FULL_38_20]HBS88427.1 hypothetical protein [Bacteroidales bacterium]
MKTIKHHTGARLILMILTILTVFFTSCNSNEEQKNTKEEENLPEVVKGLPVGIEVTHIPNEMYAEVYEKDSSYFIWKHKTIVKATVSDLQIVEFGTMNFIDGKWRLGNYTKTPFSKEHFEMWYQKKDGPKILGFCKGGRLEKGVEYIDNTNYSIKRKDLTPRNGLWYYIAVDDQGNKYVGYGRYKTVGKMLNPEEKK